jgi:hypothetical protein
MASEESNRSRGPLALLFAVLAFLGIRNLMPEAPPARGGAKERAEAAADKGHPPTANPGSGRTGEADPLVRTLLDFTSDGKSGPAGDNDSLPEGLPDIKDCETRALIACVPDPVDSSSGDRFDSLIDAIQRAAEKQGYALDRYYYPWPGQQGPSGRYPGRRERDEGTRDALRSERGPEGGQPESSGHHVSATAKPRRGPATRLAPVSGAPAEVSGRADRGPPSGASGLPGG